MQPKKTPSKKPGRLLASLLLILALSVSAVPALAGTEENDVQSTTSFSELQSSDSDVEGDETSLLFDESEPESEEPEEEELEEEEGESLIQRAYISLPVTSYAGLVEALEKIADEDDNSGEITLGANITLEGTLDISGLNVTVQTGGYQLKVEQAGVYHFEVKGGTLVLEGGVLDGGGVGGGINVTDSGSLEANGTTIQNCNSSYAGQSMSPGGAVRAYQATVRLNDVLIDGCHTGQNRAGGGVTSYGSDFVLERTTIQNCTSATAYGGSIYINTGTGFVLGEGSLVTDNATGVWVAQATTLTMRDSTITRTGTSGVYMETLSKLIMHGDSEISHNVATTPGGGVRTGSNCTITMNDSSRVTHNTTTGKGGGIAMDNGGGTLTMSGSSQIAHNTTTNYGGGLYLDQGNLTMSGTSQISYNSAHSGGGMFVENQSSAYKQVTLYGTSSFIGNSATNVGGGMYLYNTRENVLEVMLLGSGHRIMNNTAGTDGGGVYTTNSTYGISFSSTYFSGNHAGNGAYLTNDSILLNNYENAFGKFVLSSSVPEHKTPYIFNNYDIYHKTGTSVEPLRKVEYYVDGVYRCRQIVDVGTATTAPSLADLQITLGANQSLDGWYTAEDKVGDAGYMWSFDKLIEDDDIKLYAKITEGAPAAHKVTVAYYQDSVLPGNFLDQEEIDDIADGTPTMTAIETALGAGWKDLYKPDTGDYGTGMVQGSPAASVTADMTIEVVYSVNTYTVTVKYYQDSVLPANYLDEEEVEDITSGTALETALATALGAGWKDLYKPAAGYHGGVVQGSPAADVTANMTIEILYDPILPDTVRVTYAPGANGTGGTAVDVAYGTPHTTLSAAASLITRTGYEIVGWSTSDGGAKVYNPGEATPSLTAALTLYPVWQIGEYQLTFDTRGGTPIPGGLQQYNSLVTRPITDPELEGHEFIDWYKDAGGNEEWDFDTDRMPAGPLTIYAVYEAEYYEVVFDYGYNNITLEIDVMYGTKIARPTTPSRAGYVFGGWQYNGSAWDFNRLMPAHDVRLVAKWTLQPTTSTPTPDPEPSSSSSSTTTSRPPSSSSEVSSSSSTSSSSSSSAPSTSVAPQPPVSSGPDTSSRLDAGPRSIDEDGGRGEPGDDDYVQPNGVLSVFGNELPMGGMSSVGGWSVFNLLLALIALASAIATVIRLYAKRNLANGASRLPFGASIWQWVAVAAGALPLVFTLVFENFGMGMMVFSKWTPLIVGLGIAQTALGILGTVLSHMKKPG